MSERNLIEEARAAWAVKKQADEAQNVAYSRTSMTKLLRKHGFLSEDENLGQIPADSEKMVWEYAGLHWRVGEHEYHGPDLMRRCPHCDDPTFRRVGTCKDLEELGKLLDRDTYPTCPCRNPTPSLGDQLADLMYQIAADAVEQALANR